MLLVPRKEENLAFQRVYVAIFLLQKLMQVHWVDKADELPLLQLNYELLLLFLSEIGQEDLRVIREVTIVGDKWVIGHPSLCYAALHLCVWLIISTALSYPHLVIQKL